MLKYPKFDITNAERDILEALWKRSPLSANEIVESIQQLKKAHPQTIKSLINRLLKKKAIGFQEKLRKYHYFPKLTKAAFYSVETNRFLNKFYDGKLVPLLTFFASREKLTKQELKEIKIIIENMESSND